MIGITTSPFMLHVIFQPDPSFGPTIEATVAEVPNIDATIEPVAEIDAEVTCP